MFHGNIKSALSYYFRSIYLTFDDSVKSHIDLGEIFAMGHDVASPYAAAWKRGMQGPCME